MEDVMASPNRSRAHSRKGLAMNSRQIVSFSFD